MRSVLRRSWPFAFGASLLFMLAACSTNTRFVSTWRSPNVQTLNPAGHKVAAVFITDDESTRRAAEDELVKRLDASGAQAVAAYTVIPSDQIRNTEVVKARLAEAGVEGVLTMRVLSEKQRVVVEPQNGAYWPYYHHFGGYWGYGWGAPGYAFAWDAPWNAPQRVSTQEVVSVETLVYSLGRDELLWSGTSRTVNPREIPKFVNELADAAAEEMKKEGLLTDEIARASSDRH